MRDYFKPLSRKLGVLTLVMACALMAIWMRSYSQVDFQFFPHHDSDANTGYIAISKGYLMWGVFRYYEFLIDVTFKDILADGRLIIGNRPGRMTCRLVPFWLIVLPLTFPSAYLLLSKPPAKRTTPELDRA